MDLKTKFKILLDMPVLKQMEFASRTERHQFQEKAVISPWKLLPQTVLTQFNSNLCSKSRHKSIVKLDNTFIH